MFRCFSCYSGCVRLGLLSFFYSGTKYFFLADIALIFHMSLPTAVFCANVDCAVHPAGEPFDNCFVYLFGRFVYGWLWFLFGDSGSVSVSGSSSGCGGLSGGGRRRPSPRPQRTKTDRYFHMFAHTHTHTTSPQLWDHNRGALFFRHYFSFIHYMPLFV